MDINSTKDLVAVGKFLHTFRLLITIIVPNEADYYLLIERVDLEVGKLIVSSDCDETLIL